MTKVQGRDIRAVIFDLGGTLIEYAGSYLHWPELETPGFMAAYEHLNGQGAVSYTHLTLPTN